MSNAAFRNEPTPSYRPDDLLTVPELAAHMRLSPATVQVYVSTRPDRLPPRVRGLGRAVRWRWADVVAYFEEASQTAYTATKKARRG